MAVSASTNAEQNGGLRGGLTNLPGQTKNAMLQQSRLIIGVLIMLSIGVVVLNTVFTLDIIANSTGPFADIITTLSSVGGSALVLLVVGLLALVGNTIMNFWGGGF